MNFGEILNKWENKEKGKDTNAVLETWMRDNEVYHKDLETDDKSKSANAQERRRRLKNKRPDAEIDIHGLNRDEAWQSLNVFFNDAKNKEMEKLLIIHGKGNHSPKEPVLKRLVLEFIEQCPFAGESGKRKSSSGSEGATWVLLK